MPKEKYTSEKTAIKKDGKLLLKLLITRTDQGVEVFLKSALLEKLWANCAHTGASEKYSIKSSVHDTTRAKFYELPEAIISWARATRHNIQSYGDPLLCSSSDTRYNYSIVRTVGIAQGVTVLVSGIYPLSALEEWSAGLAAFCKQLFAEFLRPVQVEVALHQEKQ